MASKSFAFLHLLRFLIETLLGIVIFTISTKPAASFSFLNNQSCSSNFTFTPNSTYDFNLKDLLSTLSYKARFTQSYNTTSGGKNVTATAYNTAVYGLFICRGDVSPSLCEECFEYAVENLTDFCPYKKEAIIWYDECMLRYSYRNFLATMEEWPKYHWRRPSIDDDYGILHSPCFYTALGSLLKALMSEAPIAPGMFLFKEAKACHNKTLYGFAQCTSDLSTDNCSRCLRDAVAGIDTSCCDGVVGERFVFPTCIVRYEIYAFAYGSGTTLVPKTTTDGRTETRTQKIAIVLVVLFVFSMMLFCLSCYFLRTKASKFRKAAIFKENFGHDVTPLESLQYDLATIDAATNKFSDENLIGRGGFGEVYKATLLDGQEIAVKKLSTSSRQGGDEFKNEVLLIDKLQHNNLVRLLGFCLNEKERMLIYEYVPNGSQDYFLFDSQKQKQLSWLEQYKIIKGIIRGILYLHEDSRLKVIHRDLKSRWMDDLLSYAWKQWRDPVPLELLDPTLKASFYSENEVVKCIHIGLLCVQENPDSRPTIATIASYLSNPSVEMPFPQEPAFVMHGGKEQCISSPSILPFPLMKCRSQQLNYSLDI